MVKILRALSMLSIAFILSSNLLVKLFKIYFTESQKSHARESIFGMRDSAGAFVRVVLRGD